MNDYVDCRKVYIRLLEDKGYSAFAREDIKKNELVEKGLVKMALGIYALQRVVMHCRGLTQGDSINRQSLLRLWSRRAADGSRSLQLLPATC